MRKQSLELCVLDYYNREMITFASNLMGSDHTTNNTSCEKDRFINLEIGDNRFSCTRNPDPQWVGCSFNYAVAIFKTNKSKPPFFKDEKYGHDVVGHELCDVERVGDIFKMFTENPDRPLSDYEKFCMY